MHMMAMTLTTMKLLSLKKKEGCLGGIEQKVKPLLHSILLKKKNLRRMKRMKMTMMKKQKKKMKMMIMKIIN